MIKYYLAISLYFVTPAISAQEADTLYVPQDFQSVQQAIDAANDGDVIHLSEGTYSPGQTLVIDHKSIVIEGCCDPEDVILSGGNSHRVLNVFGTLEHHVQVRNLTLSLGRPGADGHASALRVYDCNATFQDLVIEQNGGGTGNTVAFGSGRNTTLFERCIVRNNSVENYAGLRSATARNCILHHNNGWNNTGVLADCESINCTVFANGGGAGNPWTSSGLSGGTARNCIFWNNSAQAAYNPESVFYSLNSGYSGEGNINGNPMFVNSDAGDFSLLQTSPAIDAGDPNPDFNDSDGSRNDMGAIAFGVDFYVQHGCMDPLSCNYDPYAEEDDGSCLPHDASTGCIDPSACNFNAFALCGDDSCIYPPFNLSNCNEGEATCGPGTVWDSVSQLCVVAMPADTDFDGCVKLNDLLNLLSEYGNCDLGFMLEGCTDPEAENWEEDANHDDGSCIYSFAPSELDELVFECYLDFTGPSSCTTPELTPGAYYLEFSGTWCGGSCWNNNTTDSAYNINHPYAEDPAIPAPVCHFTWNEYCPQDDVSCDSFRPTPDVYNPAHVYFYPFTSQGGAETIYGVSDECCWWDNSGGLNLRVFRAVN
jgi:hypothetical protein